MEGRALGTRYFSGTQQDIFARVAVWRPYYMKSNKGFQTRGRGKRSPLLPHGQTIQFLGEDAGAGFFKDRFSRGGPTHVRDRRREVHYGHEIYVLGCSEDRCTNTANIHSCSGGIMSCNTDCVMSTGFFRGAKVRRYGYLHSYGYRMVP